MTSALPIAVRVAVTLLAIGGTAGHVAYLDALWWHSLGLTETVARDVGSSLVVVLAAHAVVSIVSAGLAVVLVLHEGPREAAARGLGIAFGAWSYLMAYSGVIMLMRPDPGMSRDLFEGHFLLIEAVGLVGLLRFTALFPEPLDPAQVDASASVPAVLTPLYKIGVWMLRPAAPWLTLGSILVLLWISTVASGAAVSDAGLSPVMDVVRLAAAALVVWNLRLSWDTTDAAGRSRMEWLIVAFLALLAALAIMIGGMVFVAVTGFPEPEVAWRPILLDVGLVGFLVGLAVSTLYSGPVRPRAVGRRLVTIGSFVTTGLFLAAGLEALLSGGVLTAFSIGTGVGSAIALATMVSTYRGFARLMERALPAD